MLVGLTSNSLCVVLKPSSTCFILVRISSFSCAYHSTSDHGVPGWVHAVQAGVSHAPLSDPPAAAGPSVPTECTVSISHGAGFHVNLLFSKSC